MALENRIALPGSDRKPVVGAEVKGPIQNDQPITATIVLKRRSNEKITPASGSFHPLTREQFALQHGADPAAYEQVEKFAHEHGLTVTERLPHRRSINVSGTAEDMQKAFGTALQCYEVKSGTSAAHSFTYRGRTGQILLPAELEPVVMAVLGLDNRPAAKPHFRVSSKAPSGVSDASNPAGSFTPPDLAKLYNFPTGVTGSGQTIGIIELGGGYRPLDLKAYFKSLNIVEPKVVAVSVDGGHNKPGGDADGEVMLDIEVAGSVAPGAKIVVYFAGNTDQGFHDAIAQAVHDTTNKPAILSISWGQSEDAWTEQARTAMNAALQDAAAVGVTVTVAAGDDGATDGATDGKLHCDFPASSPFVLACGGTKVVASNGTITQESVWNELSSHEGSTGGGVSDVFPLPAFQNNANVPASPAGNSGRGVPDVSGDADPVSGYVVRVDGKTQVIGGTSAVAPLWAGLLALVNQQLAKPVGFVNPLLYQLPASAFREITEGGNGGYNAGKGWNPCTGLGSPNGAALVKALQGAVQGAKVANVS